MKFTPKHDPDKVLHSPFDYDVHNQTFKFYCEVVITPEGVVEYAVPSHQAKMEAVCRDMGIDPFKDCPADYYYDYLSWLEDTTKYIAVWYDMFHGPFTDEQKRALRRLQMHGCCDFKEDYRGMLR